MMTITTKEKVLTILQILFSIISLIALGFAIFAYAYLLKYANSTEEGAGLGFGASLILYIFSSAALFPSSIIAIILSIFNRETLKKFSKIILILNIIFISLILFGYLIIVLL